MNIKTSMWILLCDASAQCEICCRESCLRCSHRGASPAQMWVSPRKVLSNRSIFSGFPPLPPSFFFNKQYVRGNTESPEIGVEVRNVSFKFSLTSTSAASRRRALRRGAWLRPPTSQRSTRVRRDDEKSWASPRCFGARGNSWCSGWTFEGIIGVDCKWNCFKHADSTTGTMTRHPVLTWSGTSPRENQSRAMFVAWVAKPVLTETHHHAYKATFIPIREPAHAPADIATLTVPT